MSVSQTIGICGLGVVGGAIENVFKKKKIPLVHYDKYKKGGIGSFKELLKADILFLCLPTPYSKEKKEYDKTAIHIVCSQLQKEKYKGIVVLKSTVEPGTTRSLHLKYKLKLIHNPEFLTARIAEKDFEEQDHIVLGGTDKKQLEEVSTFYKKHWPGVHQSHSSWEESETMKIAVNSFYSVKIQFFNEIYQLCQKQKSNYKKVTQMMLRNGWIANEHIRVPGPDGKLSYGGMCFPKDTNALCQKMTRLKIPCAVLQATIKERNKMRQDD